MKFTKVLLFLALACTGLAQQTPLLFDAQTNVLKRPTAAQLAAANPDLAGGGGTWGSITGTLSSQTDLQAALDAKQALITFGTGVQTALGVNIGSAGAPILLNGALGTPSSGTVTNLTGTASININGTVGATTPAAGTFTTLTAGSTTSLLLGTAGSAVGNIGFRNATSGTATLAPPTGALGTYTVTLPNAASTLPIFGQQLTFTGPSTARTVTFPDANFTAARTDAANTFTGVQSMTSPALTTSLTTPSTTFALLNTTATTVNAFGAATTLNFGASATQILNFGGSTTASEFRFLEPSGSGTNYSAFKAQAQGSNITYTLPSVDGSTNDVLVTNGSGTLTWAPRGSGTVSVVASGTLTSTALVTGGGTQLVQTPSATATLDSSGNLSIPGTFTAGSFIRPPATITITEASPDTGTIDITKGYSQATIDEATTFTPSAAGTAGQFLTLDVTNSGGSAYTQTVDTATDFTFTAAASATTTVVLRSNGSGWFLVGGDPSAIGLTADTSPAGSLLVVATDPSTGTQYKSTINQLATADSTIASTAAANAWADGVKQTFNPDGTNAGINVGSQAGDPGSPANGDIWYDSSNNTLDARINGSTVNLGAGGGTPGGSGSEIQYRSGASTFGAVTNSSVSGVAITQGAAEALGTTPTAYHILRNTTAAAAGAQQVSPSLQWLGQGWKTNATAASQEVGYRAYVLPVEAAANPSANWLLQSSINGGAYTTRLTVQSNGEMIVGSTVTSGGDVYTSSSGSLFAGSNATGASIGFQGSKTKLFSRTDGELSISPNTGTVLTFLGWGGAGTQTANVPGIGGDAVNGLTFRSGGATPTTWNDSSTSASGTVANRYLVGINAPTLTATNSSVTNTIASSVYIGGEPTGGTNVTNTASYSFYIAAGDVRWAGYGAGALTTDANGVITAASDARLKDIKGDFKRGLNAIKQLRPTVYRWKPIDGRDTEHDYSGFIAQEVQDVIPEAIGQDKNGYLTLSDRPITAALVNAVKELDAKTPADWWARGMALAALILAIRANLKNRKTDVR